jgi:hypothetical protein
VNLSDYPAWAQPLIVWGSILAVLGLLVGFISKWVWPFLKKLVELVDVLDKLPQFMITTAATLAYQEQKIDEIHHELNYNNETSVKDATHRIEKGVKGIYDRLDAQDRRFDTADQAQAELREDLEQTTPRRPARKRPTQPKETP